MYQVLIADDNKITTESIILTIDWKALDCGVIGDCGSGVEALRLTEKNLPDLVITDIKMPDMDGLEFTERVKEKFPWIKVIIITGYNEFSYAQKALKLGAFDFILKPIDNDELTDVIKRAVEELEKKKIEQFETQILKNTIASSKDQLMAKEILDSIAGIITMDSYHYMKNIRKYLVLTLQFKISFKSLGEEEFHQLIAESIQAVETLRREYPYEFVTFWLNDKFTIVVSESVQQKGGRLGDNVTRICSTFVEDCPHLGRYGYSIGVSELYTQFSEIKKAYRQSLEAMEYRFYYPDKKIIAANFIGSGSVLNEAVIMKKVYEGIRDTNPQRIRLALEEIQRMLEEEMPPVAAVKNLLAAICTVIYDHYYNEKLLAPGRAISHSELAADINDLDSLSDGVGFVLSFLDELRKEAEKPCQENWSKVTSQIMDYLNEHYDKKISLQQIADHVCLTPTHLCRVIKKDTGESFVDLFNKIKIGMAEKLLRESNLKVYEVANKVGIDNYSYFTILFKKYTGTSPTKCYKR